MYQRKVDVDMLNAVKSVLADVSSVSPLSDEGLILKNISQHTLYGVQHIHINLTLKHCIFYRYVNADLNQFSQGLVFHCIKKNFVNIESPNSGIRILKKNDRRAGECCKRQHFSQIGNCISHIFKPCCVIVRMWSDFLHFNSSCITFHFLSPIPHPFIGNITIGILSPDSTCSQLCISGFHLSLQHLCRSMQNHTFFTAQLMFVFCLAWNRLLRRG